MFGGNSEIALAIVEALAARDGRLKTVVLAVRDPDDAPGLAALQRQAIPATAVAFDADATATHEAVVDRILDAVGPDGLDVAIVAFAVLGDQERAKRDPAAAVQLATTNFVGAVSVLTILGDRLARQSDGGTIVVLSSVAAERARRANYPYGATKAGLDAFAQGVGDALAARDVHVLVVRPGWVRTKMTAGDRAKPLATDPQRVAADVVDGLRRGAHTVWSPRVLRPVFALMRALPRPLWRRLER